MTRKRSAYRPRGVNPHAHLMAMQGSMKLSRDDALQRAEQLSISVLYASRGTATTDDWRHVFDAINMAEAWVQMGVASDATGAIAALQDVVVAIMDRARATGTRALRAPELAALRDFAATYADLLVGVTHSEYFQAQERVEQRVRRVLAGEVMACARVIEAV